MKAALLLCGLFVGLAIGVSVQAQDVTVTSIKANLRGTPSSSGVVVTTVNRGETFELIKDKAPWYLVQTPTYVGWIHGNSITLGTVDYAALDKFIDEAIGPKTTSKPVSAGESPFQSEYVGGESTTIRVVNQTDRLLTLNFGGVKYTVSAGAERQIEVDGGRYEYYAFVPRANPVSGVKEFGKGYAFSWRFFIVRR